ncbi:MAG TPA: efflux RND transporter permease subunit [Verrucomicrobiae bacterium]|nr:efflux RND transporter permease subunit [Verrucomicrobiae bacterium]
MFLPQVSIKRPVLTMMMSLALVIFGLIGLRRLPVRELPNIDPPVITVLTVYRGASASVMETEITERLEEQINSIEGIRTLSSESSEEVSTITVEFNLSRDIDLAAQDVRDRVARVRGKLPKDIDEPVITKQEADAQPVIWIALNSDRLSTLDLTTLAENQIKDRLQTLSGVSSVVIGGEKRFAMRLWLDSEKMAARQVTVLDVEKALKQQNLELPSGRVENFDRTMSIQTLGEMKTPEEYNDLVIRSDGANLVRLRDIGNARVGVEDEHTVARSNGRAAVGLGVVKQSKANTIEVAHLVKKEVEALRPGLPAGVEAFVVYDESVFVEKAIHEVWVTLGVAFVLVVAIIFVFLRSVRSTIIPAVAIPISILATFFVLNMMGYSINILTMLALVLAIGVVVDDAIVVLENIYRHVEAGMPPMQAAVKAMDEIGFAILAITFSLVAVFLPLAFLTTETGRLFIEFAVAVASSVVISAFVALSLTPMMSARILKPVDQIQHGPLFNFFERGFKGITNGYGAMLRWCLAHRWISIGIGATAYALTPVLFFALDYNLVPEEDKGQLFNIVLAPEGSTSEYTDRMMRKMERIVSEVPEVSSYFTAVALAESGPGKPTVGFMFMTLKDKRTRSDQQIVNGPGGLRGRFYNEVEGAFCIPQMSKAIGFRFQQPYQLVIQSQDLDALNRYSGELVGKLRSLGYLPTVRSQFEVNKPELRLAIDRDRAAALGVSVEDISRTLQMLFGGLDVSRIKREGKEYLVMVQLERASRLAPADLDRLYVRGADGKLVQLSNVVRYEPKATAGSIFHYNRSRSATIEATPEGVPLGTVVAQTEKILNSDLPPGFRYQWAGDARDLKEASGDVLFVIVLALVIIYMVLAAQFESLIHPITVMGAVPLAGLGAFGLLWLLNFLPLVGLPPVPSMNRNVFSLIGLVLLVGLVTKNSILLVEFANQQREKGMSARDAMLQAGLVRLRPILMTALCTIAGIMPIAIGFGAGAESRRPMGIAVVGGMITSTFLTLIIIPVVYTLFSDLASFLKRQPAGATADRIAPVESPVPMAK